MAKRKREREKTGRKISGSSNGNKTGTHIKFSLDSNPLWIQKHPLGYSQICHGTHIKFKLGFQSSFKSSVPNKIFYRGTRNFLDLNPESWFQLRVPNTHIEILCVKILPNENKWTQKHKQYQSQKGLVGLKGVWTVNLLLSIAFLTLHIFCLLDLASNSKTSGNLIYSLDKMLEIAYSWI